MPLDDFERWFAGSKVVDKKTGAPMTLYHGTHTPTAKFTRRMGMAGHFGSKRAANDKIRYDIEYGTIPKSVPTAIMPVHLAIKNPLRVDDVHFDEALTLAKELRSRKVLSRGEVRQAVGPHARRAFDPLGAPQQTDRDANDRGVQNLVEAVRRKGYDGFVYANYREGIGEDTYIPFHPHQIRSAITKKSRGLFLKSRRSTVVPAPVQAAYDSTLRRHGGTSGSGIPGDLEGMCLECSQHMRDHLRAQGYRARVRQYNVSEEIGEHWTVDTEQFGEWDPTIAHWTKPPQGVSLNRKLYQVTAQSPHSRWRKDPVLSTWRGQAGAGPDPEWEAKIEALPRPPPWRSPAKKKSLFLKAIRQDVPDREAFEFTTGSIAEALPFEEAHRRVRSEGHAHFRALAEDIDQQLGLKASHMNAIGDTKEWGSEPSLMSEIDDAPDWDTVRYSAAWKGRHGNQKAVLPFMEDAAGQDHLYRMDVPTKTADLPTLRADLDAHGLEYRTFVPHSAGTHVLVYHHHEYDPENETEQKLSKLGASYGQDIQRHTGKGEFLGGETRAQGLRAYRQVISAHERRAGTRRYAPPRAGVHLDRPPAHPERQHVSLPLAASLRKAGGMADTFGFYTPDDKLVNNTEPNDSSHESIAFRLGFEGEYPTREAVQAGHVRYGYDAGIDRYYVEVDHRHRPRAIKFIRGLSPKSEVVVDVTHDTDPENPEQGAMTDSIPVMRRHKLYELLNRSQAIEGEGDYLLTCHECDHHHLFATHLTPEAARGVGTWIARMEEKSRAIRKSANRALVLAAFGMTLCKGCGKPVAQERSTCGRCGALVKASRYWKGFLHESGKIHSWPTDSYDGVPIHSHKAIELTGHADVPGTDHGWMAWTRDAAELNVYAGRLTPKKFEAVRAFIAEKGQGRRVYADVYSSTGGTGGEGLSGTSDDVLRALEKYRPKLSKALPTLRMEHQAMGGRFRQNGTQEPSTVHHGFTFSDERGNHVGEIRTRLSRTTPGRAHVTWLKIADTYKGHPGVLHRMARMAKPKLDEIAVAQGRQKITSIVGERITGVATFRGGSERKAVLAVKSIRGIMSPEGQITVGDDEKTPGLIHAHLFKQTGRHSTAGAGNWIDSGWVRFIHTRGPGGDFGVAFKHGHPQARANAEALIRTRGASSRRAIYLDTYDDNYDIVSTQHASPEEALAALQQPRVHADMRRANRAAREAANPPAWGRPEAPVEHVRMYDPFNHRAGLPARKRMTPEPAAPWEKAASVRGLFLRKALHVKGFVHEGGRKASWRTDDWDGSPIHLDKLEEVTGIPGDGTSAFHEAGRQGWASWGVDVDTGGEGMLSIRVPKASEGGKVSPALGAQLAGLIKEWGPRISRVEIDERYGSPVVYGTPAAALEHTGWTPPAGVTPVAAPTPPKDTSAFGAYTRGEQAAPSMATMRARIAPKKPRKRAAAPKKRARKMAHVPVTKGFFLRMLRKAATTKPPAPPKVSPDFPVFTPGHASPDETNTTPAFVSGLARHLDKKMPRVASLEQVRGLIWDAKGGTRPEVKKDEVEWSGIKDLLDNPTEHGIHMEDTHEFKPGDQVGYRYSSREPMRTSQVRSAGNGMLQISDGNDSDREIPQSSVEEHNGKPIPLRINKDALLAKLAESYKGRVAEVTYGEGGTGVKPRTWDDLTNSEQERIAQHYVDYNLEDYINSERENWGESDEPKIQGRRTFLENHAEEWLKAKYKDWLADDEWWDQDDEVTGIKAGERPPLHADVFNPDAMTLKLKEGLDEYDIPYKHPSYGVELQVDHENLPWVTSDTEQPDLEGMPKHDYKKAWDEKWGKDFQRYLEVGGDNSLESEIERHISNTEPPDADYFKDNAEEYARELFNQMDSDSQFEYAERNDLLDEDPDDQRDIGGTKYAQYQTPFKQTPRFYREHLYTVPAADAGSTSGHFNEDNLAVHARVAGHEFPGIGKVTHIEEIQSDAAKGKDTPGARLPFTKDYHELPMKRLLRDAVDRGDDALTWTSGAQQADRWSSALRGVAQKLEWEPDQRNMPTEGQPASYDDGVKRGRLIVYGHDGEKKHEQDMDEPTLVQHIGKEAAKRLLAAPLSPSMKKINTYSLALTPDMANRNSASQENRPWVAGNITRVQFEQDPEGLPVTDPTGGRNVRNRDAGRLSIYRAYNPETDTLIGRRAHTLGTPVSEVQVNSIDARSWQQVRNLLGEEVHNALLAQKPSLSEVPGASPRHTLEGKDIIVGGQGYADVYDREMVNFANKYTKKWGGKVEDADVSEHINNAETPGTIHVLKITPQMREALKKEPQMLFSRRLRAEGALLLKAHTRRKDLDDLVSALGTFVRDARAHSDDDDTLPDPPKKVKRSRSGKTVILPDGSGFFVATVGKSAAPRRKTSLYNTITAGFNPNYRHPDPEPHGLDAATVETLTAAKWRHAGGSSWYHTKVKGGMKVTSSGWEHWQAGKRLGAGTLENLAGYVAAHRPVKKSAALPNRIPGGLADKAKKKAADFDSKRVAEGAKVEREHTSSQKIAEEIARDHLTEDPHYYRKLKRMVETKKSLRATWAEDNDLEDTPLYHGTRNLAHVTRRGLRPIQAAGDISTEVYTYRHEPGEARREDARIAWRPYLKDWWSGLSKPQRTHVRQQIGEPFTSVDGLAAHVGLVWTHRNRAVAQNYAGTDGNGGVVRFHPKDVNALGYFVADEASRKGERVFVVPLKAPLMVHPKSLTVDTTYDMVHQKSLAAFESLRQDAQRELDALTVGRGDR